MQKNASLKNYNTFGIDVKANWLTEIDSTEQLLTILDDNPQTKKLILGQGSNVLFLNDFEGIVILNKLKGKKIISETDKDITIKVAGGENWHELVMWAVEKNYGGIENLALIPGKAGTAPIQNIGAYGVEIKDVIENVYAINMTNNQHIKFSKNQCQFVYRNSIFKQPDYKGKFFIEAIEIKLTKKNHQLHTDYGAIKQTLVKKGIKNPSVKDIAEAVISIRQSKLPDPKKIGNAGSFFKNPIVKKNVFEKLLNQYPKMPFYKVEQEKYKIPAGWLIEQAGFKGKRYGNVGVHEKQALVLVNYGKASGKEIENLAKTIITAIEKKFYIILQPEVNFIS